MANFHPDYAATGFNGRQVLTPEAFAALKPVFDDYAAGRYKGNAEAKLAEIAAGFPEIKSPAYFAWWLVTIARSMEYAPKPPPPVGGDGKPVNDAMKTHPEYWLEQKKA